MATPVPLKTQRTARFARQPSIRSQNLRGNFARQESKRISKSKATFPTSHGWWKNPQKMWIKCEIVQQEDDSITIRNDISELIVSSSDVLAFNPDVVADLTSLRYLHEPAILYNLQQRLLSKSPYTYMGSILIAVNPFSWLSAPDFTDFVGKSMNPEQPHPFAIAELCSQQICLQHPKHQSVVISGESGAGKTESAKLVLNHIVKRGTYFSREESGESVSSSGLSSLEDRLVKSSPLLEAFGNAKTSRNSNSSRFGKYIRMFFSPLEQRQPSRSITQCSRKIAGASIETYLLEKSRVTSHSPEERNFHVFYYLVIAKANSLTEANLTHSLIQDYSLLSVNQQGVPQLARTRGLERQPSRLPRQTFENQEGVREGLEQFMEIQEAMNSLNYSPTAINSIWNIVAAILEIGNIMFTEKETPEGNISQIINSNYLSNAANLLGITVGKLECCLTMTVSLVRGEMISKSLNISDSINAKNAICKSLYASLFNYIVTTINVSLSGDNSSFEAPEYTSIGVLDIFGFESFQQNEFEQLLINYANEVLQSSFNIQVFSTELKLYQEENISTNLTIDECPNNLGCVQLLDHVLATLETLSERTIQPNENFFEAVNKEFDKRKGDNHFVPTHPKDRKSEFKIRHYADTVTYHAGTKGSTSWSLKNNDKIPKELKSILIESSDQIIRDMIDKQDEIKSQNNTPSHFSTDSGDTPRRSVKSPAGPKKQLISAEFKSSISNLCLMLANSNCSFIRCIKPNKLLEPLTFDEKYSLEQIRSLGLVQVCSVMQIGLPTRLTYMELKALLGTILSEIQPLFTNEPEEVLIASLLYAFDIPSDIYHLGRTRLFFKAGQLDVLEKILTTDYDSKRDQIIFRIKETIQERQKCEEMIQHLKSSEKEINQLINRNAEWIASSQERLTSKFLADKDEIHSSYTKINLDEIGEKMSYYQNMVDDVKAYGEGLSSHEDYLPIQKSIASTYEDVLTLEKIWKNVNSQYINIELFLRENILLPVSDCYKMKHEELARFRNDISALNFSDVIFDANRCLISKALSKGEEIQQNILKLKDLIENDHISSEEMYTNLETLETASINQMRRHLANITSLQNESVQMYDKIMESCSRIRQNIDDIRQKIIADAIRLREEIELAKEQERIQREKRELEAALELELKEQERIAIEETDVMMREDQYSRDRERLERFGFHKAAQLDSIIETDENDEENVPPIENEEENVLTVDIESLAASGIQKPIGGLVSLENIALETSPNAHPVNLKSEFNPEINSDNDQTRTHLESNQFSAKFQPSPSSLELKKTESTVKEIRSVLQKQSGFLGLWKQKYFVLTSDSLRYYKNEKDFNENNGSCKIFVLRPSTILAYTKLSLVFKIINEDARSKDELCLMAESKKDLDSWINGLKKAISHLYLEQKKNHRKSMKVLQENNNP